MLWGCLLWQLVLVESAGSSGFWGWVPEGSAAVGVGLKTATVLASAWSIHQDDDGLDQEGELREYGDS